MSKNIVDKFLCIFLIFIGVIIKCNVEINANEELVFEEYLDGYQVSLKDYTLEHIIIPDIYNSKPVLKIKSYGFQNAFSIKTITLGKNIKVIDNNAFQFAKKLESVIFNQELEIINSWAFANCESLSNVTLPKSLIEIGDYAFNNCVNLSDFIIGENTRYIGHFAFDFCSKLKYNFYEGCRYLGSTNNSYQALIDVNEEEKKEFTIHNDTLCIAKSAFQFASKLNKINFNDLVEVINDSAFENKKMAELILPKNLEYIGKNAFKNCSEVKTLIIENKIKEINDDAFCDMLSLEKVTYNGNLSDWCKIKFTSPTSNPKYNAQNITINDDLKNILIPSDVTSVNDYTFVNFDSIEKVIVHENIKYISRNSFYGCSNIKYNYHGVGRYIGTSENQYYILITIWSNTIDEIKIHEETKIIGAYTFEGCLYLKNIIIPNSVSMILKEAFINTPNLNTFKMSNNITYIDPSAFNNCGAIKEYANCYYLDSNDYEYAILINSKEDQNIKLHYNTTHIMNDSCKRINNDKLLLPIDIKFVAKDAIDKSVIIEYTKTLNEEIINNLTENIINKTTCEHLNTFEHIIKESTCQIEGEKEIICEDCKEIVKVVSIEKKQHTIVIIEETLPTKDKDGLSRGEYCSECKETILEQEVLKYRDKKSTLILMICSTILVLGACISLYYVFKKRNKKI